MFTRPRVKCREPRLEGLAQAGEEVERDLTRLHDRVEPQAVLNDVRSVDDQRGDDEMHENLLRFGSMSTWIPQLRTDVKSKG